MLRHTHKDISTDTSGILQWLLPEAQLHLFVRMVVCSLNKSCMNSVWFREPWAPFAQSALGIQN